MLDIEPSSCNDAFRYFFLHFGSDKLQEDMQAKNKSYLISTNVHLINHNNFSLIILLVLYAANNGTFSMIDWLFNSFEISFFTANGSRRHFCIHLPEIKKRKHVNIKIDSIKILVRYRGFSVSRFDYNGA
jgi:hypothetical protein